MNHAEWTTYFRQNRRDRRGISWHEPVRVPAPSMEPVARALGWLARVERRDARRLQRWTRGEPGRLLIAEKFTSALLWDRSLDRLGKRGVAGAAGMEFLTGPWSVAAVMARDAVMLRLLGTMRAGVSDPVLRVVCEQVMHDKKFHIRFLCAWQGRPPRWIWRLLGGWAVVSACWRHAGLMRMLRVPVRDFVRGCRLNLAAEGAAMYGGRPFSRDAADQVPVMAWSIRG
jgi:hypothetical protein